MARLEDKARQFEPIEIVTRDGEDEVGWTVQISVDNEMRLRATVELETDLTTGISKTRIDVVKCKYIALDCVVGWTGVTRQSAEGTDEPVGFSRELFECLPRPHIRSFIHAFCVKAMTDEFPPQMTGGEGAESAPSEAEEE